MRKIRSNVLATLAAALSCLGIANTAAAKSGIVAHGAFLYTNETLSSDLGSTSTTSKKNTSIDAGGGYLFDLGIYLGLKYLSFDATTSYINSLTTDANPLSTPTVTNHSVFSSVGLSLGFMMDKGLYAVATALVNPVGEVDTTVITSTTTAYSKSQISGGYGYNVDVGYLYSLTQSIGLGPQLTYYYVNYKKYSSVDATTKTSGSLANYNETKTLPYLTMSLHF